MLEIGFGSSKTAGCRRFEECLEALLEKNRIRSAIDGDDKAPGHSISQAEYSLWRDENLLPDQDIRKISAEEIAAIHQGNCWVPSHAEACPRPLDLLVFECATRVGPRRAIELLQTVLEVPRDGIFGPVTREAVLSRDGRATALRFMDLCRIPSSIAAFASPAK
jgi:lysozyme family protein